VGIGIVFGALIIGVSRNPSLKNQILPKYLVNIGFKLNNKNLYINRVLN